MAHDVRLRRKRFKTIKLIVEEIDWKPKARRLAGDTRVGIRVALPEVEVRRRLKDAGGKWAPKRRVWDLRYDRVVALSLRGRIVVEEMISDTAIKTPIAQHIVVDGVPSEAELEAEILKRYRSALSRRGFRYYHPATNIFIYVYATREQALAGQGLWIAMIGKGGFRQSSTESPGE